MSLQIVGQLKERAIITIYDRNLKSKDIACGRALCTETVTTSPRWPPYFANLIKKQ